MVSYHHFGYPLGPVSTLGWHDGKEKLPPALYKYIYVHNLNTLGVHTGAFFFSFIMERILLSISIRMASWVFPPLFFIHLTSYSIKWLYIVPNMPFSIGRRFYFLISAPRWSEARCCRAGHFVCDPLFFSFLSVFIYSLCHSVSFLS